MHTVSSGQPSTQAKLILSRASQQQIRADIYHRRQIEACGLLTGRRDEEGNWLVQQAHPLPNIFNSPVYFEFAPEDVLAIDLAYPDQVIGAYHSHPSGPPRASSTDRDNMQRVNVEQQIPWAWLIASGPFEHPKAPLDDSVSLSTERLVAYHHYDDLGLRQLHVHLEHSGSTEQDL